MGYKAEELEKNRKAGLDKMVVNTECKLSLLFVYERINNSPDIVILCCKKGVHSTTR
jgi:hypothetical protein